MESSNSTVKTPEADSESPARIQPKKLVPFSNGLLKLRAPPLHQQQTLGHGHGHPVVVTYRECLKNHAASIGGHAVDGCGEFMPSSTTSYSGDPASFKCAACGCHRNFHRRDPEEPGLLPPSAVPGPAVEFQSHHRHLPAPPLPPPPPPPRGNSDGSLNMNSPDSPPPISSAYYPSAPHMLLALSHGLSSTPPDRNSPISAKTTSSAPPVNPGSRKRFRSRFTLDQKEKMLEFSERLGWKMQKKDDGLIREFCAEIGVEKGVLKVWMHNNKNALTRPDHRSSSNISTDIPAPPPPLPPETVANGKCVYSDFISPAPEADYHQEDDSDDSTEDVHNQEMSHRHLRD